MGRKFDYKYVVIGSGAAGTAAALVAAQNRVKTAIVEMDRWGGRSLNYGEVPYRAALKFSHLYTEALRGSRFGLSSANLRYNFPTVLNWQNLAVRRAGGNSKKDLEDAGVTCFHGMANFLSPYEISVGSKRITAENFLIATGTVPDNGGITGLENVTCLTPATALNINRPPKTLIVVGGGTEGCEIAQYFAEIGTKVMIIEANERILAKEDPEVGQVMGQYFEERLRVKVLTSSRAVAVEKDATSKRVVILRGGQEKVVRADEIVLATGANPALNLGLENAGVKMTNKGLRVDKMLQTSVKHIAAAGDVLGAKRSTEQAAFEGNLATMNLLKNTKSVMNENGFINVVNTEPQVATVGLKELDCKKQKIKYRKVLVSLSSISASNTEDFRVGFIKMIADKQGKILGATVMCSGAELIIQEIALAVRHGLTTVELASTPHTASSWNELVKIAARRLVLVKK